MGGVVCDILGVGDGGLVGERSRLVLRAVLGHWLPQAERLEFLLLLLLDALVFGKSRRADHVALFDRLEGHLDHQHKCLWRRAPTRFGQRSAPTPRAKGVGCLSAPCLRRRGRTRVFDGRRASRIPRRRALPRTALFGAPCASNASFPEKSKKSTGYDCTR